MSLYSKVVFIIFHLKQNVNFSLRMERGNFSRKYLEPAQQLRKVEPIAGLRWIKEHPGRMKNLRERTGRAMSARMSTEGIGLFRT